MRDFVQEVVKCKGNMIYIELEESILARIDKYFNFTNFEITEI